MVLIVVNLATHILSKSTPSFLENPLASVNFPLIFKLGLNSAFKWKNLVSMVCTCVAWVPVPRGRVHVLVPGTWVQQWYVPRRTLMYHEQCFRTGYFIKKIWVRLVKMVWRTSILGTAMVQCTSILGTDMVRPIYKTNSRH